MPTVFDGVDNDMRIAREEIFGPVVGHPVRHRGGGAPARERDAVRPVGSIWSRDIGKALRAAKGLQTGVISVNSNSSVHTEAPFGGYKMSGIGRELGMARSTSTPRPRTSTWAGATARAPGGGDPAAAGREPNQPRGEKTGKKEQKTRGERLGGSNRGRRQERTAGEEGRRRSQGEVRIYGRRRTVSTSPSWAVSSSSWPSRGARASDEPFG